MLSQPEGPETAGNSILYYSVDDVEAAYRTMAGHGAAFEEAPRCQVEGKDAWLAICRDSEGNLPGLVNG